MARYDVVVVGGGTAGCVLAARLSEDPARSVCLVEAGPDYGPYEDGGWPAEILDARALPTTNLWGGSGDDTRTLGGRLLGGSSAVNACAVLQGSRGDYDEWGEEWSYERFAPFLDLARTTLRTARANTEEPGPFHRAFVEAATAAGFPLLSDPNDPAQPVGVAPYPANVVDGTRWNTGLAYLAPARARANLIVEAETTVDRVLLEAARASGVVTADGRRFEAETVVLSAGAYFSAAILCRSGIGPESELGSLAVPVVAALPVGDRLLDHHGVDVAWRPTSRLDSSAGEHEREHGLFTSHVVLKAAGSRCEPGSWDLHLLTWLDAAQVAGRYDAYALVFHMKPLSTGRVRLRSTNPHEPPAVERGYLSRREDLETLVDGIELARRIGSTDSLRKLLAKEAHPGSVDPERYVRETVRNYFHPAGTCPIGEVVDANGRVLGVENLVVADASIMPTIPRANTNLTVAAVAEKLARTL
jgi:choline dehydrogenase